MQHTQVIFQRKQEKPTFPCLASLSQALGAQQCPSEHPGGMCGGLSAHETPNCILCHSGYHNVIGRALCSAVPITICAIQQHCHCVSLLLFYAAVFLGSFIFPRFTFLPDMVSQTSHPLLLRKDSLQDFTSYW